MCLGWILSRQEERHISSNPFTNRLPTEQVTTMTEEAPADVKRRRITAADGPHEGNKRLVDLPTGILAHAASFLAAPSRALFAIALENSAATPNERSSAIVGNQLDTLDFGEIGKELAVKLLDADINEVLLCIDAVNNVKRLKLTNCTKIFGICLEPLRGSVVIEQIDLSLAGDHQNPDLNPILRISCEFVLPILDSIIERDCTLMHLQFPSGWRKGPLSTEFHAFIERYNEIRRNRGTVHCETATLSDHYGTQLHTCYDCLKHYCYKCNIDGEKKIMMNECNTC